MSIRSQTSSQILHNNVSIGLDIMSHLNMCEMNLIEIHVVSAILREN
jgi:hypothetical protein